MKVEITQDAGKRPFVRINQQSGTERMTVAGWYAVRDAIDAAIEGHRNVEIDGPSDHNVENKSCSITLEFQSDDDIIDC